jgi:glycosyltransferase involved in cell wall biosynthesis
MSRRVLHVLASNDRRGAEVFAAALAGALTDHGWDSTLVALRASTSTATVRALTLPPSRVGQLRGLRRLAADHDVVVAHGSTSLPACAIGCTGAAPFIYRSIGDPSYWSAGRLKQLRTDVLLSRAHTVVALFDGARDVLARRRISAALEVIPNAVRAEEFPLVTETARSAARDELGVDGAASVVLFLGALSREKRPERAVGLARARPEITVLIVGDGALRATMKDSANQIDNAHVLGPTERPRTYLAAADLVVVPSDTEGIPAVAIEAGLSGLPVVASDVGGLSAVIDHERTGLLVPVGDDVALVDAVDQALADGTHLGEAARRRCVDLFDIEPVARQWAEVMERAARPRTGA